MSQNALPRGNACLNCRKKKQKCDAAKPSCHSCSKTNKVCVYGEQSKNNQLRERVETIAKELDAITSRQDATSSSGSSSREQPSPPRVGGSSSSQTSASYGHTRTGSSSPGQNGVVIPGAGMVWNASPTSSVNPAFSQAVPASLRESLIQAFLQNRDLCCFDLHVVRFLAALALPPKDPRAPHPALVQAILLMGCYFHRSPSLADYEVRFLAQARHELSVSFTEADRLHDFVRAANLVAFYYFCKGMYAEAYQQVGQSVNMAVSCGMHQIQSSLWRPASQPDELEQFLPYPFDNVDLGERIHTFWQTVSFDRLMAMVIGQPSHLVNGPQADPALRITTPWPRLLNEYENGNVSDMETNSLAALYDPRLLRSMRPDTLSGLRSQGLCLVQYAYHLSHSSINPQDTMMMENAIRSYQNVLPGIRNGGEMGELIATPGLSPVNHRIVFIRTLPLVANLILFRYGVDTTARQRVGVSTQAIVAIIKELGDGDYPKLFLGLGHIWHIACEILINIYHVSQGPIRDQVYVDLGFIMHALKKLSLANPLLGFQVKELERLLANPTLE